MRFSLEVLHFIFSGVELSVFARAGSDANGGSLALEGGNTEGDGGFADDGARDDHHCR